MGCAGVKDGRVIRHRAAESVAPPSGCAVAYVDVNKWGGGMHSSDEQVRQWVSLVAAAVQRRRSPALEDFRARIVHELDAAESMPIERIGVVLGLRRSEWQLWVEVLPASIVASEGVIGLEAVARRVGREPRVLRRQVDQLLRLPWASFSRLAPADLARLCAFRVELSREGFKAALPRLLLELGRGT